MTPDQLRLVPGEQPDEIVERAIGEHAPIAVVCLYSGGGDSGVLAHRCREHYSELVFVDTGTALPGVIDHVERFAAWLDKPLRIMRHDEDAYRNMVLGADEVRRGENWAPLGFPGPAQHGRAYNRLKKCQLERLLRELKVGRPRSAHVLALTGVRRAESQRRAKRASITRHRGMAFANPLIDWNNQQMRDYRLKHRLPESDVAALIHRSGECNCGSYAAPGEREMLAALWPDWFADRIERLEREAAAAGVANCRWGPGREAKAKALSAEEVGELCTDCQVRMEL